MNIIHPLDMYDVARFYSKVKVSDEFHCWEWLGNVTHDGYGRFGAIGEVFVAHRMSYMLFHGAIPEGLLVRHKCDNPKCVSPFHLETGTHTDNARDRVIRGRSAAGERNGMAKLTEVQVMKIVHDPRPYKEVAKDYGVHTDMIGKIKRGRTWGKVTGIVPPRSL